MDEIEFEAEENEFVNLEATFPIDKTEIDSILQNL
jgi:hypothetical protein